MRISVITPQKKKSRFNVMVDGSFWCGVSASVLARFNLYEGKELSEDDLVEVFRSDIEGRLYERCLRFIGTRPRSEKELRRYLKEVIRKKSVEWLKGSRFEGEKIVLDEITEKVLGRLSKESLLDDDAFARWWIEQRTRGGMKGWIVIRQELLGKGVASKIIDRYKVSEATDQRDARRAYQKLCTRPGVTREQCIRRLLSRGFPWEVVKKLVNIRDEDELYMD